MKTENVNNPDFQASELYQNFLENNKGSGGLLIRAYAANEAIPIEGMKIIVSTIFNDVKIIFFEGVTDNSGMIKRLQLPAPATDPNDLNVPKKTVYQIEVPYILNNTNMEYSVNIYDGVCVIQNINPIPNVGPRFGMRKRYGS